AHSHEKAHHRFVSGRPSRTDVPTREDVAKAKRAAAKAEARLAEYEAALRVLEGLARMGDEDVIEDWAGYQRLQGTLDLDDDREDLFQDEDEPFTARHARAMLRMKGAVDEVTKSVAADWRDTDIPESRARAGAARKTYQGLRRRYEAALDRRRRAHG